MAARAGAWVAIIVGAVGGTVLAVARTPSPAPPPPPAEPIAANTEKPTTALLPNSGVSATASAEGTGNGAPLVAAPSASVSASASAGPVVTASLSAAPPPPSVPVVPAPATKEALLRAEMRCDQRDAAACSLASRAYETGSAGLTDHEKAQKYRRIALTMWITQCDKNSPVACGTLARMYRSGDGVPVNEKSADALLARARELCHYNDAPICHEL